jgi:hypothetical protein
MADDAQSSAERGGLWNIFGWAAFLGCSWTWCIGMFLPVLLLRDFGFWGWLVFAVPNVVGAAAMGWTLRDADASRRMVERHAAACAAFSVVTILFHVLFVGWIVSSLIGAPAAIALTLAAVALFVFVERLKKDADTVAAGLLWLVSVGIFVFLATTQPDRPPQALGPARLNLLWLSFVCLFGFALCPYLDLTFHRARQASGRGGAAAFTLGFGLLFALMIVFTLWYAPYLLNADRGVPAVVTRALAAHMIAQTGFTVAVHGRSLWGSMRGSEKGVGFGSLIALLSGFAILGIAALLRSTGYHGLSSGEVGYRLYLAFYGLVFPAYVWICVIPRRTDIGSRLIPFLAAIVLAAPLFWLGFIERRYEWLAPGVAILVAGRWFPVAFSKSAR